MENVYPGEMTSTPAAAPAAPVDPEAQALAEKRDRLREALPLQQQQIHELEESLDAAREQRRKTILAATAPVPGKRAGVISYDEVASLLEVSKSAVYKMAKASGWKGPGLKEQGVRA